MVVGRQGLVARVVAVVTDSSVGSLSEQQGEAYQVALKEASWHLHLALVACLVVLKGWFAQ